MTIDVSARKGMKRMAMLVALFSGCLFLSASQAMMVAIPVEQLAAEADTILVGTVTAQTSEWNADRTAIHTDVTLGVDELFKGDAGTEVVVRVPGGYIESEDIGMGVSDTPKFQDGEQVLLFLNQEGEQAARVTGQFQGKLTVTDGSVTTSGGEVLSIGDFIDTLGDAAN